MSVSIVKSFVFISCPPVCQPALSLLLARKIRQQSVHLLRAGRPVLVGKMLRWPSRTGLTGFFMRGSRNFGETVENRAEPKDKRADSEESGLIGRCNAKFLWPPLSGIGYGDIARLPDLR